MIYWFLIFNNLTDFSVVYIFRCVSEHTLFFQYKLSRFLFFGSDLQLKSFVGFVPARTELKLVRTWTNLPFTISVAYWNRTLSWCEKVV